MNRFFTILIALLLPVFLFSQNNIEQDRMDAEGARRAAGEEEYRATVDLRSQRFRARVVVVSSVLLGITLCVLAAADPDDGRWRPTVLEEVSHDRGWEEAVKLKFEPFIALAD